MILTGHPIRVRKKFAVVKHMFYDPMDVRWFKPAEMVRDCIHQFIHTLIHLFIHPSIHPSIIHSMLLYTHSLDCLVFTSTRIKQLNLTRIVPPLGYQAWIARSHKGTGGHPRPAESCIQRAHQAERHCNAHSLQESLS